jgi:aminoglycoside phosphotransferase (APT) family kinase protein
MQRLGDPPAKILVRLEPTHGPFLTYDGAREAALIRELSGLGLPVPRVVAVAGPEICGTGFMVVDWIEGHVFNPHEASRLDAAERGRMAAELASMLAQVHAIPVDALQTFDQTERSNIRPEVYLEQFDATLDGLVVVESLVLDYVRAWLAQHLGQSTADLTLVHGDFRLGNLVWDGGFIAGVLDWETARLGNPLFDLGWVCMGAQSGADSIMGLLPRDQFVQLYCEASRRDVSERDVILWQVAAAWVRGCTELRLLDLALTSLDHGSVDPRDLSWQFGSFRTEQELLELIDAYEHGR